MRALRSSSGGQAGRPARSSRRASSAASAFALTRRGMPSSRTARFRRPPGRAGRRINPRDLDRLIAYDEAAASRHLARRADGSPHQQLCRISVTRSDRPRDDHHQHRSCADRRRDQHRPRVISADAALGDERSRGRISDHRVPCQSPMTAPVQTPRQRTSRRRAAIEADGAGISRPPGGRVSSPRSFYPDRETALRSATERHRSG